MNECERTSWIHIFLKNKMVQAYNTCFQSQGHITTYKMVYHCNKFNAYCLLNCQDNSMLIFCLCQPTVTLHQGDQNELKNKIYAMHISFFIYRPWVGLSSSLMAIDFAWKVSETVEHLLFLRLRIRSVWPWMTVTVKWLISDIINMWIVMHSHFWGSHCAKLDDDDFKVQQSPRNCLWRTDTHTWTHTQTLASSIWNFLKLTLWKTKQKKGNKRIWIYTQRQKQRDRQTECFQASTMAYYPVVSESETVLKPESDRQWDYVSVLVGCAVTLSKLEL